MSGRFYISIVWLISLPTLLLGQDIDFWVQVEAHPNQAAAIDAVRSYSNLTPDVNAYEIGAGWFVSPLALLMRPKRRNVFELRSTGVIPLDSFLSRGSNHQDKIWPVESTKKNTPKRSRLWRLKLKCASYHQNLKKRLKRRVSLNAP